MIPSQMLKGMLEGCILKIIECRETYAYEISKQLENYGFGTISEGTIYPIILRLQKNELVSAVVRESRSGPKRKYYHLTEKGVDTLREFEQSWTELDSAVNLLLAKEQEGGRDHE
nr:PadR family transcriptional regulator [Eubacterium sp.]